MLSKILDQIKGTHEHYIISEMEKIYTDIENNEKIWKEISQISCPDSCGKCCEHFEPDITENEALYLAAWLIENQPKVAERIIAKTFIPKENVYEDGCILFDPHSKFHCTVYNGRCLICRLFGFSGDHGKREERRWKPCKFLPQKYLEEHNPSLKHKQYEEEELKNIFNALPPTMSDFAEQSLELSPDTAETEFLRVALPKAIGKLEFLLYASQGKDPKDSELPLTT